jgi:hypothetical protein
MSRIITRSPIPEPVALLCRFCGTVFEPEPFDIKIMYNAYNGAPYWGVRCPVCDMKRLAAPDSNDPGQPQPSNLAVIVGAVVFLAVLAGIGFLLYTVAGGAFL